ncbi:PAS domain-containing sensor histidine kinase [uncultured Erythrobacter sp.]|uniref:sensor histidine kinase n=1 Tax=uncultured Erythrobacter sp. TaxID=263913 RepID=UPI0026332714|nr:PAS domain-containing sensor histidine kinase [uncultured Erythrobacter sp.]
MKQSPITPAAGKPAGIMQSAAGEDAFHSVFENAPYGMLMVDDQGVIAAANDHLSSLFGYPREELIGEKIEKLLPARYRTDHVQKREGYASDPSARAMGRGRDLTGLRRDGVEFPLEIGLSRVETSHGQMTCAAIIDITERQRFELRLREANSQLEEFTYVASHDLRSPIRGISNLIEFVREDMAEGQHDAMQKNLDRMDKRVHAVERMIDDLLTYARAGRRAVEVEEINLKDLISEIVSLEDLPVGFSVNFEVPDESFVGARTPLTTVIRNLISNAVKHHDKEVGTISVNASYSGNTCLIEVSDDGPGIPDNARERVFRLFQTLKSSERKGEGLGLAVAQRLATGHGGHLELVPHSAERGACFRVSWPRFTRTNLDA